MGCRRQRDGATSGWAGRHFQPDRIELPDLIAGEMASAHDVDHRPVVVLRWLVRTRPCHLGRGVHRSFIPHPPTGGPWSLPNGGGRKRELPMPAGSAGEGRHLRPIRPIPTTSRPERYAIARSPVSPS